MKKNILYTVMIVALGSGIAGCGNDFLDTEFHAGLADHDMTTVEDVKVGLNGVYNSLYDYQFCGNYAISIGDIPTDITYWNTNNGNMSALYMYAYTEADYYMQELWKCGYVTVSNASIVIKAAKNLYESCNESEKKELDLDLAEAYALRAYSQLLLTNIYGHQVKVKGEDFSSQPGIVIVDEPIEPHTQVSRSTVGQCYDAILSDLNQAVAHFDAAGGDRKNLVYIGRAATYGLLARTYLYLEEWNEAATYAQKALDKAGISTLTYENGAYKALYNNDTSNKESMFALAITPTDNWAENSCGTNWSNYGYSPSPKLLKLYGANDCRTSIFQWDPNHPPDSYSPVFEGGKFSHYDSGNPAAATNYLVNAPEMFLIMAEANLEEGNLSAAKTALLTVAKRNADIQTEADLPSDADGLLSFIKDERARELFQEGMRLWDLRRWGESAQVYAINAPNVNYMYNNYNISDLVYTIPSVEILSGSGVTQNDWSSTLPNKDF
ncbi:MAG: RagB/SusD family nutrient uptake outer membrane protein [Paraprevotella sp.]|nr:RagB/SusD family nutrient uptake outer membrane protein [Paraprevotella sp.]